MRARECIGLLCVPLRHVALAMCLVAFSAQVALAQRCGTSAGGMRCRNDPFRRVPISSNAGKAKQLEVLRDLHKGIATKADLVKAGTGAAVVEKNRLVFTLAAPVVQIKTPESAKYGYYAWRLDMTARDGVSEGLSMVLVSDTAMRTNDIDDILKGSTLRLCSNPKGISVLSCKQPLESKVFAQGKHVHLEVRDSTIVSLIRSIRPRTVSSRVFEPMGKFRTDELVYSYWDRLTTAR